MTLEKAIEILLYSIHRYPHILDDDTLNAVKLGIEALKLQLQYSVRRPK